MVDTAGIDERSWLDTAGHEHSAQLRLTERFKKIDADSHRVDGDVRRSGVLHEAVVDHSNVRGASRRPVLPYTCTENNRDVEHLRPYQPNLNYKHTPEAPAEQPAAPRN